MKYGQENVDFDTFLLKLQVYGSPKHLSTPMQLLAQESLATLRRQGEQEKEGEGKGKEDKTV